MFLNITSVVYCRTFLHFMSSIFNNLNKKRNSENVSTPKVGVLKRLICAQTQDLQIFKKFSMSQINPKEVFHIAGHFL